jgi:hypothetical protein
MGGRETHEILAVSGEHMGSSGFQKAKATTVAAERVVPSNRPAMRP